MSDLRNDISRPFVVGDIVLVQTTGNNVRKGTPDVEARVTEVKRKYATAVPTAEGQVWPREYTFDKVDGRAKNDGFGSPHRAWHPEDRAAYVERQQIIRDINVMTRFPSWVDKFSTVQLGHLRAILARPAEGEWPKGEA